MFPPRAFGDYDDRFAPVVARFEEHLASTSYGGASLAVFIDGDPVIDVWGGLADVTRGREWQRETLALLFSCSKSVATIVMLTLVERGVIDLDAEVSRYWPEFAANGKDNVTVRDVLAHRAGVPLVDSPLTFDDVCAGGPVVAALEKQAPFWEPGSAHAYHAITVGAVLGEIVRRATGRTFGTVLREELSEPFGLDLWMGLPSQLHERAALFLPPVLSEFTDGTNAVAEQISDDDRPLRALTLNGALEIPVFGTTVANSWNRPSLWQSELPAANAMSTARSLAKLHAALVSKVEDCNSVRTSPIVGASLLDSTRVVKSEGEPAIGADKGPYPKWGTGFMIPAENRPMLGSNSFGHDGAAGGLCFADSAARLGFAFLPSIMGGVPDRRVDVIVDELRDCL
ncbi:serine hydrolase domain-containing protein [Rhodococcoides fascians]|uniref:serine hydrolase domain-containing protein n=1 Tax=Rhodococcoides fascians TaxID=1828 RepID=UPI0015C602FF|nr:MULTISPECIES: serine hydrolase domain-containing protein [Rhodococcus]